MTPLQNFIEEANKIDNKPELFSNEDLKSFTDLLDTQEEFDELLEGFNSPDTATEINKIGGIQETIKTYVATQKGLEDLTSILGGAYTVGMANQELYEVCTLGAILTGKATAKEYYESINVTNKGKEKTETLSENNFGTNYETGNANTTAEDILNSDKISVKETTTLDDNKKITGATVTIAAGADTRKEDITKGKEIYHAKKEDLKTLANSFTGDNKKQINEIFFELYGENIDGETSTSNFEIKNKINADTPQEGNYYLIGARVAEGFIDVLNTLTLQDPEPTLTLDINWDECVIGKSTKQGDIADDRFLSVYLEVKKEDIVTGDKKQSKKETIEGEGDKDKGIVTYNPKTGEGKKKNGTQKNRGPNNNVRTDEYDINEDSNDLDDVANNANNMDANTKIEAKSQAEKPIDNVESAEIISLKKELTEHFTINGKAISREIDISNTIVFKDNIYTVAIQGYTGLQFAYDMKTKKIEVKANTGGIRKGLFLYDVATQSVATDKTDKKDIVPKFNTTKTIEVINKQLESNDQDGDKKADYKVKSITGTKMEFEYGVNFVQDTDDAKKIKIDTFTLDVDDANNIILPDSQEVGQVSQWKKSEGKLTKDTDFIFDNQHKPESGRKILYYAKTKVNDTGTTELTIMNNIQKTVSGGYESIYTDHKEMTNPEFKEIKEDFLTNKIERIFAGTLHERHQTDFQNNWKITKSQKGIYNFEITFNKNDGKQQHINIPFTPTNMGTNTRNYIFGTSSIEANIDNVIYDINTPMIDGVPSIKMIENKEKTLNNAEKNTSKNIVSDVFSERKPAEKLRGSDNNRYEVQPPKFSLGTIEFDGKGGYKRTILFGEQKDANGNVLLHGEEKGTIYFDQDYKIIHINVLKNDTEEELDFGNTETKVNMENVLEDDDANQKGVILAPTILTETGKPASLQLKFDTPAPKETNINRQNADLYLNRIREEKETIFKGLKTLSTTVIQDTDAFKLPNLNTSDEASYPQKIMGPDGKGLYQRRIAEADVKGKYLEQNIYCKVEGKSIALCDSDGNPIESIYMIDYKNKEYYELKIDATKPESFSVKKLDDVEKKKLISLETEKVKYQNTQVSFDVNDNTIDLLQSNLTDRFTFSSNKHEMCTIYLDDKKKLDDKSLTSGKKKPQIIEPNKELFGSYKKYFAGEGRENLGIAENEYEGAFKEIYNEYQGTDTDKKIIQVKLRSSTDNKYYYEYMAVKQSGTKFSLEKLEGLEKAKEEMKKRLDNLVALDKMQASTKGDSLRGVKINTKDNASKIAYLKNKTSPVKITLSDTAGKTTPSIEITMKDYQDRVLKSNTEVALGNQKINCTTVKFEDGIPLLKIELVTQTQ